MATFVEREDASIRLKDLELLERKNSRLQHVALYKHRAFGHVLVIDGELQHVEAWQSLYHEPLIHVPASFIRDVRSVLILGGGDLFAAREALKYPSVRNITLVEHDRNVIDLTLRHYRHGKPLLTDKRLDIRIADARQEFSQNGERYDLIINDCFDLASRSTHRSPYESLEQRLTSEGVCSDMIYRHVFCRKTVQRSLSQLNERSHVILGLMTVPEYPGAVHILTLWGRNRYLSQSSRGIQNKLQKSLLRGTRASQFDYYNPRYRAFHLYIPPYVRAALAQGHPK